MRFLLHPAALAAGSLAALAAAFAFQHLGGLEPCPLCIWQRWPHAATVLLALLALGVRGPAAALAVEEAGGAARSPAGEPLSWSAIEMGALLATEASIVSQTLSLRRKLERIADVAYPA